ncbi:MAG: hypothetical protein IKZ53_09315 [Selenomonadaceae bacterium]|nr:hypothetical protein [Selenomonadaceae bacterium]
MMKKIFLICLAILLGIQCVASAKSNLSEEKRINIAVEVTDTSRHKEFGTADNLELFLSDKLVAKNLVNIIDTKIFGEEKIATEKKSSYEKLGELLVFDAIELPVQSETPENFEQNFYKNLGADYVVRCEVLALGWTKVEDKTLSAIFGATGGIISLIGSGSKSRDKTLRRVGTGIGFGGFIQTERTAFNNVVNVKFISVETGQILWQGNFMGQGIKHHNPYKGYDDVWTQAYMESVEKSAELISKRVNKYVDKVIIKGKSDKSFKSNKSLIGGAGIGIF